jgi:uncharacterized protein YbaR (Trm112 family)
MSADHSEKLRAFDVRVLERLACPVCFGELRLDAAGIACAGCLRVYPLIDGIPVLIAERAIRGKNVCNAS